MRVRHVLLTLLLSTVALGPAPARAESQLFEVTARWSAAIDVEFTASTRFDTAAATAVVGGSYAILHVESLSSEPARHVGIGFLPISEPGEVFPFGHLRDDLLPGRYRVSLFTDGPAVIRVPATGGAAGLSVRPVAAVPASATVANVPLDSPDPVTWRGATRLPIRAGSRPLAVYGARLESGGHTNYGYRVCLVPSGQECPKNPLSRFGTTTLSGGYDIYRFYATSDGGLPPITPNAVTDFVTEYEGLHKPPVLRSFLFVTDLAADPGCSAGRGHEAC